MTIERSYSIRCARLIRSLAQPHRLGILRLLSRTPLCISDLVKMLLMGQPKVSHHLAILKTAGLVVDRRQGRKIIYSLNPKVLQKDGAFPILDFGLLRLEFPGDLESGNVDDEYDSHAKSRDSDLSHLKTSLDLLKKLGQPRRLAILFVLFEGARSIDAICSSLHIDETEAHRHLSRLEGIGTIMERREKKATVYLPHPAVYRKNDPEDVLDYGFLRVTFRLRRAEAAEVNPQEVPETTAAVVEVSLHREAFSDREMRAVLAMAVDFMETCGFQARTTKEAMLEAYFQRLVFETAWPVTQGELNRILENGREALWLSHLKIDPEDMASALAKSARRLMRVLESCSEGVLRFGPILAVKVTRLDEPAVLVGIASPGMMHDLESIPGFLQTPGFVFDYLSEQTGNGESDPDF